MVSATAKRNLRLVKRTDVELANERVDVGVAEEARKDGEELGCAVGEGEGRSLAVPPDDLRVLFVIEKVRELRAREEERERGQRG